MSVLGAVFVVMAWTYVFVLVVVDRCLDPANDLTVDAMLEAVDLMLSPRLLLYQVTGAAGFYLVGSWFFGWVVGAR